MPALREHRGFIVDRTVPEMKHQMTGDSATVRDLSQIPVCDRRAFKSSKHKESVNQALGVLHGDRFRTKRPGRNDRKECSEYYPNLQCYRCLPETGSQPVILSGDPHIAVTKSAAVLPCGRETRMLINV